MSQDTKDSIIGFLLTLLFLGTVFGTMAAGEDVVKVRLSTQNGFAPLTVRVTTTVEPHPDNRYVCLMWDSAEGEAGSSCLQLDGANAARTNYRTLRLGSGEYVIQATVERVKDGKSSYHLDKQTLSVLEPGAPYVR